MPRLLILCEYATLLGGERSMLATLAGVAAAGFAVHVASPSDGPLVETLAERGIPHEPWRTRDGRGERLPLAQLRAELATVVNRVEPQLVHANSLSTARISGPIAAWSRVISVGHLRDIVKLPRQQVDDLNSHRALIAVSNATREFHVAQGVDGQRCVVSYNGVDLDEFWPRQPTGYLHRELRLSCKTRLIAVIGQLGLRKGTDVALAAAELIAREVFDVHFLVVGERTSIKDESRDLESRLHSAARIPPLAGRVHFLGQRRDVRDILVECTLLAHAARQEPLGRVLLESAASGLPVVATDVGGTREIFRTEADGALLVPGDDAAAMASRIIELLQDDERRYSLGAAGRRRAERQFDIRQAAARLIEIYQTVLT